MVMVDTYCSVFTFWTSFAFCFIACSRPAVIFFRTLAFFCFSHKPFWYSSTNHCYIWLSWMMDLIVVAISITNDLSLHATHVECTISWSDMGETSWSTGPARTIVGRMWRNLTNVVNKKATKWKGSFKSSHTSEVMKLCRVCITLC